MTHSGLEQLRYELSNAESVLRNVMTDEALIRALAHGSTSWAQAWRGLKQAQAEIDFLRAILSNVEKL